MRRDGRAGAAGVAALVLIALAGCAGAEGESARFDYDAVSADPVAHYGRGQGGGGAAPSGAAVPGPVAGSDAGLLRRPALERRRDAIRPGQSEPDAGAPSDRLEPPRRPAEVRRQRLERATVRLETLRVGGQDRPLDGGTVGERRRAAEIELDRLERQDRLDARLEQALDGTLRSAATPPAATAPDPAETLRRDSRRYLDRAGAGRPGPIGGGLPDVGAYGGGEP